jgi:hypothetical protein
LDCLLFRPKNLQFLPTKKRDDATFKRNLVHDIDGWLLAEMEPVARRLQNRVIHDQDVNMPEPEPAVNITDVIESPHRRMHNDPYTEFRDKPNNNLFAVDQENLSCERELRKYKALVCATSKNCPLEFWKEHTGDFPIMAATATSNIVHISKFCSIRARFFFRGQNNNGPQISALCRES